MPKRLILILAYMALILTSTVILIKCQKPEAAAHVLLP